MPASVAGLKTSARISWQQSRSVADFIFIADHIWCCKRRRTTFARNFVAKCANPYEHWRFHHRRKFAKTYQVTSSAASKMPIPHKSHTGSTLKSLVSQEWKLLFQALPDSVETVSAKTSPHGNVEEKVDLQALTERARPLYTGNGSSGRLQIVIKVKLRLSAHSFLIAFNLINLVSTE